MALLSTVYTSEARIQRRMGNVAMVKYADHNKDGEADTDVINDAINQATEMIDLYIVGAGYDETDIASDERVAGWTTDLACCYLCTSRGNPPPASFEARCKQVMEILQQILDGTMVLPNVAMSEDMRPGFSNLKVDRRYSPNSIRVTRRNSKQEGSLRRDVDSGGPTFLS